MFTLGCRLLPALILIVSAWITPMTHTPDAAADQIYFSDLISLLKATKDLAHAPLCTLYPLLTIRSANKRFLWNFRFRLLHPNFPF